MAPGQGSASAENDVMNGHVKVIKKKERDREIERKREREGSAKFRQVRGYRPENCTHTRDVKKLINYRLIVDKEFNRLN